MYRASKKLRLPTFPERSPKFRGATVQASKWRRRTKRRGGKIAAGASSASAPDTGGGSAKQTPLGVPEQATQLRQDGPDLQLDALIRQQADELEAEENAEIERTVLAETNGQEQGQEKGVPERSEVNNGGRVNSRGSEVNSRGSNSESTTDAVEPKAKRPLWAERLSRRQFRFVSEYLIDLRPILAVRRAFPGIDDREARTLSYTYMHNAAVLRAIDAALEDDYAITRSKLLQELSKLAFHNPKDYFRWGPDGVELIDSAELDDDQAAAVAEISQTTTKDGGSIRLKLTSKQDALEKLSKLLGANRQRENEARNNAPVTVNVIRFSQLSVAERASLRANPAQAFKPSPEDFTEAIEGTAREVTEGDD